MIKRSLESEPSDHLVGDYVQKLFGLVENESFKFPHKVLEMYGPQESAVRLMLQWATAWSVATRRSHSLGFHANSHTENGVNSELNLVIKERIASAEKVASNSLELFYKNAGIVEATYLKTGEQAQEILAEAISQGVGIPEITELLDDLIENKPKKNIF